MKLVLTGAGGFLGWHTRLRLHALTDHEVMPVTRENWAELPRLVQDAEAVIHIAGVNRAEPEKVEQGNCQLADDVATAIESGGRACRIVYANTIQHGNGTPYGTGKRAASERLHAATATTGGHCVDVRLPNIFGEHGRPHYNSFVATFVVAAVNGETPCIQDNDVRLLHAQDAAAALIEGLDTEQDLADPEGTPVRVQQVWDLLTEFRTGYASGEFPDLSTKLRIDLFNTYRAALFPRHYPIRLTPKSDARGMFVETVRCRGGEGQTSFSTTASGITRGNHYHLTKIERFAVIQGQATISLRKMFTDELIDFPVTGDEPCAVDMPVGWVHNITNTGEEVLLTQFWSHELFRPEAPDTFAEPVRRSTEEDTP